MWFLILMVVVGLGAMLLSIGLPLGISGRLWRCVRTSPRDSWAAQSPTRALVAVLGSVCTFFAGWLSFGVFRPAPFIAGTPSINIGGIVMLPVFIAMTILGFFLLQVAIIWRQSPYKSSAIVLGGLLLMTAFASGRWCAQELNESRRRAHLNPPVTSQLAPSTNSSQPCFQTMAESTYILRHELRTSTHPPARTQLV